MTAALGSMADAGGDAAARGKWAGRWWRAFLRLLPLAGLYALVVGTKDVAFIGDLTPAAWRVFMMTFVGEFLGALWLFACVALVDISPLQGMPRAAAYAAAAIAGTFAGLMMIIPLYFALDVWNGRMTFGVLTWGNMVAVSEAFFAVALYRMWHRARRRAAALRAIRLERSEVARRTAASRLQAMQARIDPAFLLDSMTAVERIHDKDAAAGQRLLDDLIAYLRAALPELARTTSTVGKECDLASAYLDIGRIRDGLDLDIVVDAPEALRDAAFPPMVVLPLADATLAALRSAPAPRSSLRVSAREHGSRVSVTLELAPPRPLDPDVVACVRERLRDVDGDAALLAAVPDENGVSRIVVEVPHADAR